MCGHRFLADPVNRDILHILAHGSDLIANRCRMKRRQSGIPRPQTLWPRLDHASRCTNGHVFVYRKLGAECWSGLAALCSEFRKGWASASDTDAQTVAVSATANLGDAASGVGAASPSSFLTFHLQDPPGGSNFHLQKRRTRHSHFGEHRVTCDW